jgi:hypothetical protein
MNPLMRIRNQPKAMVYQIKEKNQETLKPRALLETIPTQEMISIKKM